MSTMIWLYTYHQYACMIDLPSGSQLFLWAMFNSKLLVYQRVYPSISQYYPIIIPLLSHYHPYKTILNHSKPIKPIKPPLVYQRLSATANFSQPSVATGWSHHSSGDEVSCFCSLSGKPWLSSLVFEFVFHIYES